jgi:hypothetical protein
VLVSCPMVASPRAYRSDRGTRPKGSVDAGHREQHRPVDERCRRSEELLRPPPPPRCLARGNRTGDPERPEPRTVPGFCRRGPAKPRRALPGPFGPNRASTCQASLRLAASRGQTGPEGSSTPASRSHGTPPHWGLRRSRPAIGHATTPGGSEFDRVTRGQCSPGRRCAHRRTGWSQACPGRWRRKTTARRLKHE